MRWLQTKNLAEDLLTETFIKTLHQKLFGQVWKWAGTFRKTEKYIGIDPIQIPTQVQLLLDDTRFWIEHQIYPPQEIAIRFHHHLVYLHPFPNGNGRHARIMADTMMTEIFRLKPFDWSGGQSLQAMNDRRKRYIAALRLADKGNYKALLDWVGIGLSV